MVEITNIFNQSTSITFIYYLRKRSFGLVDLVDPVRQFRVSNAGFDPFQVILLSPKINQALYRLVPLFSTILTITPPLPWPSIETVVQVHVKYHETDSLERKVADIGGNVCQCGFIERLCYLMMRTW